MSWDVELFRLLNQRWTCPPLDAIMPVLTASATYRWPLITLALAILAFGNSRQRKLLLGLIACAGIADIASSWILKPLVGRLRPGWTLPETRLLIGALKSASFPSSHAVNLAAAGWYLHRTIARPALSWLCLLFLLAISYSRIYVGVHYPSDVLAGIALGWALAWCQLRLWFYRLQGEPGAFPVPEPAPVHPARARGGCPDGRGDL